MQTPPVPAAISEAQVAELLRNLSSRRAATRKVAEWELRDLGPEALPHLMALSEHHVQRYRQYEKWGRSLSLVQTPFLLANVLRDIIGRKRHYGTWEWAWTASLLVLFCFMSVVTLGQLRYRNRQKRLVEVLARYDDLRIIGPLLDYFGTDSDHARRIAFDVLKGLLPRLKASDADLLSVDQRRSLAATLIWCANLSSSTLDFEGAMIVLKTLEQIGGEEAVPFVQRVAGSAPRGGVLRKAAEECLPALWSRAARERPSRMLLRPSSPPDEEANILLRPAHGVSDSDPQTLVRPSQPEA